MKAKVIDVHYRKDSETFPKWMKYQITLLWEDGTQETIPAYGKDLQDALSRVVHDHQVEKVTELGNRIGKRFPFWVFALMWFIYVGGLVTIVINTDDHWYFGGGIILPVLLLGLLNLWTQQKNKDKDEV